MKEEEEGYGIFNFLIVKLSRRRCEKYCEIWL